MKNRAVVALFAGMLLAMPALAQQPASTTQDNNQQQPAATSSGETATGKAPLQYDSRQGFWGKINPFARK